MTVPQPFFLSLPHCSPLRQAVEVASALSYLHSVRVVHGDLSGTNVLLKPSTADARFFTALVR
jgi:serine/threonine protein kinase